VLLGRILVILRIPAKEYTLCAEHYQEGVYCTLGAEYYRKGKLLMMGNPRGRTVRNLITSSHTVL
jgi:hypothetical protein